MLRENCITAVISAPTASASVDCELLTGTESLIEELHARLLAGESINNPKLSEIAERHFGGSRAAGAYSPRDAYDAMEASVSKLLESKAPELMMMSVPGALRLVLRPLTERLPRQADRTREQVLFQQLC